MSAASPRPTSRSTRSWPRLNRSDRVPTRCGFSCRRRSARPTSVPWSVSCAVSPPGTGTASRSGIARSSRTRDRNTSSSGRSGRRAEWVTFDTVVLFGSPPASDAEREAWRNKHDCPPVTGPDVPSRRPLHRPGRRGPHHRGMAALARYRGRLAARGAFPDRLHPYAQQRRRTRAGPPVPRRGASPVPEVEPLPEPVRAGPPTLF